MTGTPHDLPLRVALCDKVRVASQDQAIRLLAKGGIASRRVAKRRLRTLAASGLLECEELPARPLLNLKSPVAVWRPGAAEPDFHELAWELEKRWRDPLVPTRVYIAGPAMLRLYGGVARGYLTNLSQLSHDLHVTEVYLRLLADSPDLASAWRNEDELSATRLKYQKQPDAILCDPDGTPRHAVEFGGLYGVEKLAAFHRDMERRGLSYELW